ncbi:MogA/MoaB family molybdenum cofactor biosynthesis protein [Fredinandcohnia sp. QZ13]|uniref:MogA/MoaB family molybdenum cofactor biosynthesis protein n=1 Tax=Fredinandcohnia sp. QZ13 TaxID=3073144 RepID=UPI00285339ED|nr:MogA/MoaB family molybdenum cofactor biosynthesis protein [Fredinandcohnia sp. QZ13]MDR4889236.1 MogA/MoaB family molybdenum cofactor biosynthesis protein [Fredinandcohnia sp. QZ13]
MSVQEHKQTTSSSVICKVITISDTRTKETDQSGQLMITLLEEKGFKVLEYKIVKDEEASIERAIREGCEHEEIDVVLTNGGTGIAKRDVTIETVSKLLDKEIVGFGELFRMLSYMEDIGSAAILSRAIAGVSNDTAIFSTPGSSGAVKLAMKKLILPELGHVVREIKKDIKKV